MDQRGLMEKTMVVFTSDHGDYLGDHWLGEKDLFHDQSVRVPLIVYDPRKEADPARGTVCAELVECIDLAPTFLSYFGGPPLPHILEGLDLTPLLHGKNVEWRNWAISEYDYSTREARRILGNAQEDARLVMICDRRWKFVHCEGYRPMLFDLESDPDELIDLGTSPDHEKIQLRMHDAIFEWSRRHHTRITMHPDAVERMTDKEPPGVLIGIWDEDEFQDEFSKPFGDRP